MEFTRVVCLYIGYRNTGEFWSIEYLDLFGFGSIWILLTSLSLFMTWFDRDYASTGGFWRETREHLLGKKEGDDSGYDDDLYAVYIDMTAEYNSVGRFFTGILIDESKAPMKQTLLETNMQIKKKDKNEIPYEIGDLPSVRAAVAKFPWTDGFVSGLLHNFKVWPALYRYAQKNFPEGQKFFVSISCNREKQMCTHYIPMIESEKFLLGHSDTKDYGGLEDDKISFDLQKLMKGIKKLTGGKK